MIATYEMKTRRVTREDIDRALQKLEQTGKHVQNDAVSLYAATGESEFVVLACIGFLRHFLHLFHRLC